MTQQQLAFPLAVASRMKVQLFSALFALTLAVLPHRSAVHAAPLVITSGAPVTVAANTSYEGGTWTGNATAGLTVNSGVTATLLNGHTLEFGAFGVPTINGGGTLANDGVINFNHTNIFNLDGGTRFDNLANGVLNFNPNGSQFLNMLNSTPETVFRNLGGTINVYSPDSRIGSAGQFTTFDGTTLHSLNVHVHSGGDLNIRANKPGGKIQIGDISVASGSYLLFSTTGAEYTNAGGGPIVFNQEGRIILGSMNMGTDIILDAGEQQIEANTSTINNGGFDLTVQPGRTLEIFLNTLTYQGTGKLINHGTIDFNITSGQSLAIRDGATLENHGEFVFNGVNAILNINPSTSAGAIVNHESGIISKSASTDLAQIFSNGAGTFFDNQGTLLVPGGTLRIFSMGSSPSRYQQYDAAAQALTGGTYIVDSTASQATGGVAVLDLLPAGNAANTIQVLGENATVNLIGSLATFNQIGTNLNTINGRLGLFQGKELTVDTLVLNSTAEITLGLNSLTAGESKLHVNSDLIVNGLIHIADEGLQPGLYDLISFDGVLTDVGLALGNLPAMNSAWSAMLVIPQSGTVGGVIQLSIGIVPEPTSAGLLLIGMAGLAVRARRRRLA